MSEASFNPAYFPSFPDFETLLRLQERLLNVSRLATVGEMSSGIAHELNQPLCAVANYAQACDRMLALPNPDIAEVRETLQEISSQALRAGDIIRRLRSLARPPEAHHELTDVNLLLAQLNDLIQSDARRHQVWYHLEAAAELPQVWADRPQIQQLVLNLVRNAIEAMEEVDRRELVIRTRAVPNMVEVTVADSGPGIAPEMADRLFQPFFSTKKAGMGLGLSICREIVEAHHGRLSSAPRREGGTVFRVNLPTMGTEGDNGAG